MSVSRPRRWLGLALPLGLWLLVAACGVTPASPAPLPAPTVANPYAPLAMLLQDPAAPLAMPGADDLNTGPGTTETQPFRGGYEPAQVTRWLGTQAAAPEVFAFYDRELRAAGYAFIPGGAVQATTESDTWSWCKPQAAFRLGVVIQAKIDLAPLLRGRTYSVVLRTFLTGRDNSPCPTPQGSSAPSQQP